MFRQIWLIEMRDSMRANQCFLLVKVPFLGDAVMFSAHLIRCFSYIRCKHSL
jgi:hypothetical protein